MNVDAGGRVHQGSIFRIKDGHICLDLVLVYKMLRRKVSVQNWKRITLVTKVDFGSNLLITDSSGQGKTNIEKETNKTYIFWVFLDKLLQK